MEWNGRADTRHGTVWHGVAWRGTAWRGEKVVITVRVAVGPTSVVAPGSPT